MKKRRLVISLFLIAAVALLGIGYSAISTGLDITGIITSAPSTGDFKVVFTDTPVAIASNDSIICQPTVDAATGVDASMNIKNLANNGDTVTAYFKVQNNSKPTQSLDAALNGLKISVTRKDSDNNSVTVNDKVGTEGVDKDYLFTGQYIRVEAHFVSSYSYVDGEETKTATTATGEVADAGLSAILEAPETLGADGEFVYVKVTVTVIGSFTSETTHVIDVHFDATSDAIATVVE